LWCTANARSKLRGNSSWSRWVAVVSICYTGVKKSHDNSKVGTVAAAAAACSCCCDGEPPPQTNVEWQRKGTHAGKEGASRKPDGENIGRTEQEQYDTRTVRPRKIIKKNVWNVWRTCDDLQLNFVCPGGSGSGARRVRCIIGQGGFVYRGRGLPAPLSFISPPETQFMCFCKIIYRVSRTHAR